MVELTVEREARLVERARGGDLDAFEQLHRCYVAQVYGVCRRLLSGREDAEDMTQRVFLRAWRRLDGFRGQARLGAWLRRIAVNLMLDSRRARWRRELETAGEWEPERLPAAGEPVPGDAVDLERAIAQLPAGPRRVLVLHDVEGYTHAEIASQLGVTTGTTKTQLFRARRALREVLL